MITEIKTGDIIKIGDQIGIVEKINTEGRGCCLQVDAAAVRAKMPDSAMRILMELAAGCHIRLFKGRSMPQLYSGRYVEKRVNALIFELIRPYLKLSNDSTMEYRANSTTEYSTFDLNDEYWADFVKLKPGDPVEVWIDHLTRPDLPNRTGKIISLHSQFYYAVGINGGDQVAHLTRASLRRVFKTSETVLEAR